MNFQPKTEQEIRDAKLWKKGEYDFEVMDSSDQTSSKGHPMIELKLRLTDGKTARTISDYLLDETPEKLRHAATACGLLDRYDTGAIAGPEFKGKRGRLKLVVERPRTATDRKTRSPIMCAPKRSRPGPARTVMISA